MSGETPGFCLSGIWRFKTCLQGVNGCRFLTMLHHTKLFSYHSVSSHVLFLTYYIHNRETQICFWARIAILVVIAMTHACTGQLSKLMYCNLPLLRSNTLWLEVIYDQCRDYALSRLWNYWFTWIKGLRVVLRFSFLWRLCSCNTRTQQQCLLSQYVNTHTHYTLYLYKMWSLQYCDGSIQKFCRFVAWVPFHFAPQAVLRSLSSICVCRILR